MLSAATTAGALPTDDLGTARDAKGSVILKRDGYGVPHVYANSTFDLFRGYGYVVGQDRLFQMEMSRRSTQGIVSEVLGAGYLALDKGTRSGFDPQAIRVQIAGRPPTTARSWKGTPRV